MRVLGIETSCDETSAAIVTDAREILSNIVLSQTQEHALYGGVVPEIAARAHAHHLDDVVRLALKEAHCQWTDLDAIAVTGGPGLIGGVIVGVMTAKAIAAVHKKPFIAVNHLEGHALTVRLMQDVPFPYLLLLVSGGHCQLLSVEGLGQYTRLGGTLDDALGEAFDKVAKMLSLGYPGGPLVEAMAKIGNPKRFVLPHPLKGRVDSSFSFSGLKTAVRTAILEIMQHTGNNIVVKQDKADICAAFQVTVGDMLAERLVHGIHVFKEAHPQAKHFVVAGGVAANQYLRGVLDAVAAKHALELVVPPTKLCTDNAAMIAWAGLEHFKAGNISELNFEPRARWPLCEVV